MKYLRGKKALVTGAASGIGRAIAIALAETEADVFLVDIDRQGVEEAARIARGFGAEAVPAVYDLASGTNVNLCVQRVLSHWKYVDILVNNAGVVYWGPTINITDVQWDRMMSINLHAPIQLTRRLLPILLERPEAHIVNVASLFGLVTTRRSCAYHTSKFGLVGFSEALRTEFGRGGLGVSTICPGFVTTNLFANGISGREERDVPMPPRWVCTTPERVAARTVRAIRRDKRLVVMTPLGHVWYAAKRFAPWLLDGVFRVGRRRKIKQRRENALPKRQAA